MFKIIAVSQWGREEVDEADDRAEAHRLAREYRLAFGPGFQIKVVFTAS
jgi:hypothetical protein